jgi:hypothetical protein
MILFILKIILKIISNYPYLLLSKKSKQTQEESLKYFPNAEQVGGEYYIACRTLKVSNINNKSYSVEE